MKRELLELTPAEMNSVGLNACGILEFLVLDLSSLQDGIQVCHFVRSEVDRQYVFLSG